MKKEIPESKKRINRQENPLDDPLRGEGLEQQSQEHKLTALVYHDCRREVIAKGMVAEFFSGAFTTIAEKALRYWNRYDKPPGVDIVPELGELLNPQKEKRCSAFMNILYALETLNEKIHPEYILDKYHEWRNHKLAKIATLRSANKLANPNNLAESTNEAFELFDRAKEEASLPPLETIVPLSGPAFMAKEFPARPLLLDPCLKAGALMMVHAQRGHGKTWLVLSMGMALAKGESLLGWTSS